MDTLPVSTSRADGLEIASADLPLILLRESLPNDCRAYGTREPCFRTVMILADFTQFHQTIRAVFCQLCIALGRPWNAGDENGQDRTRRVMNLYHLLEMSAWDLLTQIHMPMISEVVHKGHHMCTNQRPKSRAMCGARLCCGFEV